MSKEKMKCPVCGGLGSVDCSKKEYSQIRKEAAILLLRKHYGIRETQRLLGYKSPQSIQRLEVEVKE